MPLAIFHFHHLLLPYLKIFYTLSFTTSTVIFFDPFLSMELTQSQRQYLSDGNSISLTDIK